jgi:hypothetical protein
MSSCLSVCQSNLPPPSSCSAQLQPARAAHWQAEEKPCGVQHEAKGTAWPPRVALHLQPSHSEANLPAGSSSCSGRGMGKAGRGGCHKHGRGGVDAPRTAAPTADRHTPKAPSLQLTPPHPHLHRASKVAPGVGVLLAAVKALGVLRPAGLQAAGRGGKGKKTGSATLQQKFTARRQRLLLTAPCPSAGMRAAKNRHPHQLTLPQCRRAPQRSRKSWMTRWN